MSTHPLIAFLTAKMSMTDVYQPAVIKELLVHGGKRSKANLARTLAQYDIAIQDYYEKVMMRWSRITLSKHGIVAYERGERAFRLIDYPSDESVRETAIVICEQKIAACLNSSARCNGSGETQSDILAEL